MQSYDIAIIGGGMIGLTLAVSLSGHGFSIAVLDTSEPAPEWQQCNELSPEPALRVSAISLATEQVFRHCQVWDELVNTRVCSYTDMDVREQDSFAQIQFSHHQVQQPYLGHIIENDRIRAALWHKAQQCEDIALIAPCVVKTLQMGGSTNIIQLESEQLLTARLLVGADGAQSRVRQQAGFPASFWDYEQKAIVATIKTELPHGQVARQVFTPTGPLAFLPLWNEHLCSIVWSQDTDAANELLALDEAEFNQRLAVAFDLQLGTCQLQSERQGFPLRMQYARQWISEGVAVIGDAAHTIHPLAGQGANLGILDAAALAETLIALKQASKDIGTAKHLRAFERWRKTEASQMVATMEAFKQLFAGSNPMLKFVRGVGMSLTNQLPVAKHLIIQRAMGMSGELPEMAKL